VAKGQFVYIARDDRGDLWAYKLTPERLVSFVSHLGMWKDFGKEWKKINSPEGLMDFVDEALG